MLHALVPPVAGRVSGRFFRTEQVVQGAYTTRGTRLGRELRWCRWLTLAIVVLDIALNRFSAVFPYLSWGGWLAALSLVACWWSPTFGVPACAVAVLINHEPVPMSCIDLVVLIAPFSSVFPGRRLLIGCGLWCFLFPAALQMSRGEFPVFALLGTVSLVAGVVTYRAWQFSLGDDGAVLGLIQEQRRMRADERRLLARELDELISERLSAVVGSLRRDLGGVATAELREAVESVGAATHQILSLMRQAISVLRDPPATAAGPPGALIRPVEYLEENLVAHGHPVELDGLGGVGVEIEQNPIAVHVLPAVLQGVVDLAPAGATCRITAQRVGDECELGIDHEPSPEPSRRELSAATHRTRMLTGFVRVEQRDGMVRWRLRLPCGRSPKERITASDVDSPWRRALMTRSTPSMFAAFLVGVWALSLLWYLYRASGTRPFGVETIFLVGAYVVALFFVLLPRYYPAWLLIAVSIIIVFSWGGWNVGHAFISLFCAGMVAFAWRRRVRLWALVFLTALCWQALLHGSAFWLVSGLVTALLFVSAGLLAGYFLERRERVVTELERQRERLADTRAAERRALAGELHDVVAHQLSLITMQAGLLRQEADAATLRAGFVRLAELGEKAAAELEALKQVLAEGDPKAEGRLGLIADAVRDATMNLSGADLDLHIDVGPDIDEVDPMVRHTVVRLLRECETNMLRYAPRGARCRILVWRAEGTMRVLAANPMAAERQPSSLSSGLGLRGLAERVDLMGGSFSAGAAGSEWVVEVSLPEGRGSEPFAVYAMGRPSWPAAP